MGLRGIDWLLSAVNGPFIAQSKMSDRHMVMAEAQLLKHEQEK